MSGDIYAPYFDFSQVFDALPDNDAVGQPLPADKRDIAWLYLTPNPWHNPEGDFGIDMYTLANEGDPKWNFAGTSACTGPRCSTASRPATSSSSAP